MKTWQIRYCESEYTTCERFRLSKEGKPVPPELLPNGMSLPSKKS